MNKYKDSEAIKDLQEGRSLTKDQLKALNRVRNVDEDTIKVLFSMFTKEITKILTTVLIAQEDVYIQKFE